MKRAKKKKKKGTKSIIKMTKLKIKFKNTLEKIDKNQNKESQDQIAWYKLSKSKAMNRTNLIKIVKQF